MKTQDKGRFMQKLWRGFLLILLLLFTSSIVLASEENLNNFSTNDEFIQQDESDEASLRVLPNSGTVGDSFTFLISGLNPTEEISVRIVLEETGDQVYSTRRTADARGRVELSIFTESSDSAGTYHVEVLNASDDVIAEDSFELEGIGGLEGIVSVSPTEGEAGTVFTIELTEVQPFADLTINVTDAAGNEVYTTTLRATVDGTATIEFESSADAIGELSVVVLQNESIEVASGSFTVLEQDFPATVILEPAEALPNDEVFVTISGLEANATVTVRISDAVTTVVEQEATANQSGLIIFSFVVSSDTPLATYRVEVSDGEILLSATQFVVDIPAPSVTISPAIGVPSSNFVVDVAGIRDGEELLVELTEGDEVLQSLTLTGDAEGNGRTILGQRLRLDIGNYGVRVYRADVIVFEQSVEIVAEREAPETTEVNSDDISVSISPESGIRPTEYTITIEGLPANASVNMSIIFDGRSVLTFQVDADENGVLVTAVTSETSDPIGTYTLEVRYQGNVIGSADFAIADETAETEPETEAETSGDVGITTVPAIVSQGERFEIFVNGLDADESVTVELRFEGEVVYSSERTADSNGAFALALVTSEDDALGNYEVAVLRGGETVASTELELVGVDAVVNVPSILVTPESAAVGSDYTVTIVGLDAGETVNIDVLFAGESVYSTERLANAQGVVTIVLSSSADDALGEYTVLVERGDSQLSSSFNVTEGDATAQTSDELSITIEPASGDIGTDHEITVTGLGANVDVVLSVEFDSEEVYRTTGQTDENGVYTVTLTTEDGDPSGEYTIIVAGGGVQVSGTLIAEAEDTAPSSDVSISISPEEVALGELFEVQVTGLESGETVTINVYFDGESVYETEREANPNGVINLSLASESTDPTGTYTVEVSRDNGEQISANLEILGEEASTPSGELSITVNPESGEIGTVHEFTISGLEPEEEITIFVEVDGEEVYRTERTADEDGVVLLPLASEEGDATGDYTLTVERENEETESIVFTVEGDDEDEPIIDVPNISGDVIVLGDDLPTFTGRLSEDEPTVDFVISGEEGQSIIVTLTSEQFDPYLLLLDENGDLLASDDDGAGNLNSRLRFRLPYSGEFTLRVSSFGYEIGGTAGEGRFELSIELTETVDTVVELGAGSHFVQGSLNQDSPEIRYIFEGEEGESVLISLNSADFDTYLSLYDEDGEYITENDDSNGSLNSQIGPFELPYTGEYTVVVSSYAYTRYQEAVSGNFEFRVENVAISETEYGETLSIEFDESAGSQFIEFEGRAGDVISITVDSGQSIDTTLSILDPYGYTVITDDDGGLGYDPEIARLVLSQDGTYTILLRSYTAGDVGEVDVTINLEDLRTLDEEARIVRLNTKQSSDILVFEGEAGELISLTISLESGSLGSYSIFADQNGNPLMSYDSVGMPQEIVLGFRVPADGTVRISIYDNSGGSNAILNVSIERD